MDLFWLQIKGGWGAHNHPIGRLYHYRIELYAKSIAFWRGYMLPTTFYQNQTLGVIMAKTVILSMIDAMPFYLL